MFQPVLLSILARMSGGGFGASKFWSHLPELTFASVIAYYAAVYSHTDWFFVPAVLWSFFAMETGHGTFYAMDGYGADGKRKQHLEIVFRPLYLLFKGDIYKPLYSWYMMGIKGFLIALPLGPIAALLNAFLWPFSYWLGFKIENNPEEAELLSGLFLGSIILCLE